MSGFEPRDLSLVPTNFAPISLFFQPETLLCSNFCMLPTGKFCFNAGVYQLPAELEHIAIPTEAELLGRRG
jgi:hypothetical protein